VEKSLVKIKNNIKLDHGEISCENLNWNELV